MFVRSFGGHLFVVVVVIVIVVVVVAKSYFWSDC